MRLQEDESVEPVYRLGEQVAGYGRKAEFGEFASAARAGCGRTGPGRFIYGFRREHSDFDFAPDETAPDGAARGPSPGLPVRAHRGRAGRLRDDAESRPDRAHRGSAAFGLHYALELGYSTPALGADRTRPSCTRRRVADGGSASMTSMFADSGLDDARRKRSGSPMTACCRPACATTIHRTE